MLKSSASHLRQIRQETAGTELAIITQNAHGSTSILHLLSAGIAAPAKRLLQPIRHNAIACLSSMIKSSMQRPMREAA